MTNYNGQKLPIKFWADEDRPREKFIAKGRKSLTNAELLSIIIRTGTRNDSALEVAKQVLKSVDNDLNLLGRISLNQLKNIKGIGLVKAVTILSSIELGCRREGKEIQKRAQIRSSRDAYDILSSNLKDLEHEEFWMLMLNRSNHVIGKYQVSKGGVAGTIVDAKIIFQKAIEKLASGIILFHNHPSGNLRPSQADIEVTKKLKKAGQVLDISVLDHLILADTGFYSFADEGKL